MKIGRNDKCSCGSGKKYKQCCLNKSSINDFGNIRKIVLEEGYDESVGDLLCNLFRYMKNKNWNGACHSSSAVLFVALSEMGYTPSLCVGEVSSLVGVFDHSWIVLDKKVIDLAIAIPLMTQYNNNQKPIIFNKDSLTESEANVQYGIKGSTGLDQIAQKIISTDFTEYMNNYPDEDNGLWGVVKIILNKNVDIKELKNKYSDTKWEVIN